jgi:hypothetical protein
MRHRKSLYALTFFAALALGWAIASSSRAAEATAASPEWTFNATIIEACSCPMFCQCYFNPGPAGHEGHEGHGGSGHFCRFNNAFKVNKGTYGAVKLDGAKFWVAGDLGGDFSKGQMDWATVYFDKTMSQAQREAVGAILGQVYPVKWSSFNTAEATIDTWTFDKDSAHATIDGGKTAEVQLKRFPGNTSDPVVIKNLKYWGTPRNDGFVLMPNDVEAYRMGPKAFEFKGSNGFMITIDMTSKDVAPQHASAAF